MDVVDLKLKDLSLKIQTVHLFQININLHYGTKDAPDFFVTDQKI